MWGRIEAVANLFGYRAIQPRAFWRIVRHSYFRRQCGAQSPDRPLVRRGKTVSLAACSERRSASQHSCQVKARVLAGELNVSPVVIAPTAPAGLWVAKNPAWSNLDLKVRSSRQLDNLGERGSRRLWQMAPNRTDEFSAPHRSALILSDRSESRPER
jgi:hypothetical protein